LSGSHAQAEWLSLQRKYTAEGRIPTPGIGMSAPTFPTDSFSWGLYGLLGYRFDWFGVMPFVMAQKLKDGTGPDFYGFHVGLNVRPIAALAVKLQYDNIKTPAATVSMGFVQLAWAF